MGNHSMTHHHLRVTKSMLREANARVELLEELVKTGVEVVEDFLPNIGVCALQDYGRLNQFLMDVDKEIPK